MNAPAPSPPTREAILDAAAREFARVGYRAATVQAIAREAGFTPPTVYAHFGTKRALFEALVNGLLAEMWALLDRELPEGLSLAQWLELRIGQLLELAARHKPTFALIFLRPHDLPELEGHAEEDLRFERYWEGELARFAAELGDRTPREAALLLDGVLHSFTKAWIRTDAPSLAPQTRRIVALALSGMTGVD